jgi:hypothetical protein
MVQLVSLLWRIDLKMYVLRQEQFCDSLVGVAILLLAVMHICMIDKLSIAPLVNR